MQSDGGPTRRQHLLVPPSRPTASLSSKASSFKPFANAAARHANRRHGALNATAADATAAVLSPKKAHRRLLTLPPASGDDFGRALAVEKLVLALDMAAVRDGITEMRACLECLDTEIGAIDGVQGAGAPAKGPGKVGAGEPAASSAASETQLLRAARSRLERAAKELSDEWAQLHRARVAAEVVRNAERLTHQSAVCRQEYGRELEATLRLLDAGGEEEEEAEEELKVIWVGEVQQPRQATEGTEAGAQQRTSFQTVGAVEGGSSSDSSFQGGAAQRVVDRPTAVRRHKVGMGRMYWDSVAVPRFIQKSGLEASFRKAHGVPAWLAPRSTMEPVPCAQWIPSGEDDPRAILMRASRLERSSSTLGGQSQASILSNASSYSRGSGSLGRAPPSRRTIQPATSSRAPARSPAAIAARG